MLCLIYLRKGQVFVPTVSKTEAGFYLNTRPVAVHEISDCAGIAQTIHEAMARGNPIVPTPTRENFPVPVVLEYAKVKSWASFEKTAACWEIYRKESSYEICPMRRTLPRGWEEDSTKIETFTSVESIANRMLELIQAAESKTKS